MKRFNPRWAVFGLMTVVVLAFIVGGSIVFFRPAEAFTPPGTDLVDSYDVIVVGSEPEGVAAAVAAAQEGARTLMITEHHRVGGLFVMGQMNSLDLRQKPVLLQRGLFEDWWRRVGRGTSFDVNRAELAFLDMLGRAGVTLSTSAGTLEPLLENGVVTGVRTPEGIITARQIIDATADADFAAAAGVPYSMGFNSIGFNERMVDTLVFRIDNVDWREHKRGIEARGRAYAEVDDWVSWGHFGNYPARYRAQEIGIRLRGLNLGRQEDGTILVNALLIYGIDPFDPASVADGFARAAREAPRIIEYLQADVPGFENATFGGVADTLYIRETRHIEALCTLTVDDVLNNLVTDLDVAAGGYPLDVQALTPHDNGYVYGTPDVYGAQLCVSVPENVENLWVVGKSAGYDPLAASSSRVVPFGMAMGEAVGIAAARSIALNTTPLAYAQDNAHITSLRQRLVQRGAYLADVRPRTPAGPHTHEFFDAYRLMLSRGLALGGYENEPFLDQEVTALGYVYLLSNVGQRFLGNRQLGLTLVARYGTATEPLTAEMAARITSDAVCILERCVDPDWAQLIANDFAPSRFPPEGILTRGEIYGLAARIATLHTASMQASNPTADEGTLD